jgi:hypothetical protein
MGWCPVSGASRQLRYEWQREVRRYQLGHTTKSVAQYLALYADNDGRNAYPGVSRLAAECEMHERTVRKALQELKRVGLIELVTQGSAAGRQAQATVYNLTLPGDLAERLELVTVQPSKPAGSRRPRTGTPGPEPGDPKENTGSTARCSDPEHRVLDPEHRVLSTGTPGPGPAHICLTWKETHLTVKRGQAPTGQPFDPTTPLRRACPTPDRFPPMTRRLRRRSAPLADTRAADGSRRATAWTA